MIKLYIATGEQSSNWDRALLVLDDIVLISYYNQMNCNFLMSNRWIKEFANTELKEYERKE